MSYDAILNAARNLDNVALQKALLDGSIDTWKSGEFVRQWLMKLCLPPQQRKKAIHQLKIHVIFAERSNNEFNNKKN